MNGALQNVNAWEPIQALKTCGSMCRSIEHYQMVVEQFQVTTNPRYAARDGATFCNIFVWDVTRAMACEIPHWSFGQELNANSVFDWLFWNGASYGWKRCRDSFHAQQQANLGYPTVAAWKNTACPPKPGHIAMVIPGPNMGITIAQAGAKNLCGAELSEGFGPTQPMFWTHE